MMNCNLIEGRKDPMAISQKTSESWDLAFSDSLDSLVEAADELPGGCKEVVQGKTIAWSSGCRSALTCREPVAVRNDIRSLIPVSGRLRGPVVLGSPWLCSADNGAPARVCFKYREFAKRCRLMAPSSATKRDHFDRRLSQTRCRLLVRYFWPAMLPNRSRCRRDGVSRQLRLSGTASNFADVTCPRSSPHRASAVCRTRSWLTGHSLCSPFASSAGAEKLSPGTLRCFQSHLPAVPDRRRFHRTVWPSQEDYDAVIQFAKANGLAVVSTSRNRMNIDVIAPVANIEKALHITMSVYQHPTENRTFYAPDREPTVELPFALCRIAGLDNYSIPRPPTTMLLTPAQAGTRRPDPARLPPS